MRRIRGKETSFEIKLRKELWTKVKRGNIGTYVVKKIRDKMNRVDEVDKKFYYLAKTFIYFGGKDILESKDDCIKVI